MPLKNGKLTPQEKVVSAIMASTGSPGAVMGKTGMSQSMVSQTLARPAVQAEIARQTNELLFRDILPLAISAHKRVLTDPRAPAGAVVQAVKLAYDRTLGSDEAGKQLDPAEMSPEQLVEAIAKAERSMAELERIAAGRAKVIEPEEQANDTDLFD